MKKIAILGGSFNPIHKGHINLALEYNKIFNFDKVLIIPTNIPPHKDLDGNISNQDRFNMCLLACKYNNLLEVSDVEFRLKDVSYTINTINKLKEIYNDSEFYLIIGSDMLKIFHKWYNYQEILRKSTVLCGSRYENDIEDLLEYKKQYLGDNSNVVISKINVIEVSSTEIRENIYKKPNLVKTVICNEVYDYIINNNLYK